MSVEHSRPAIEIADEHWDWMRRAQAAEGQLERMHDRAESAESELAAALHRVQRALDLLQKVTDVLVPQICDCTPVSECSLRRDVAEDLRVARESLA